MPDQINSDVLRHTADVVSAHLSHNQLETEALPQLIQLVYQALSGLGAEPEASTTRREPAVPIRKSVFPDYIICLEDGAKLKMIKRYIRTRYDLTPAAYRERWGLAPNYPMVAPNYAKTRSALAREAGLGRKPVTGQPADDVVEVEQGASAGKELKTRTRRKTPTAEVQE